jgi:uncharacterized protein YyaL (SSP411 family)
MHKHTNQLIHETSPYLLQHAHNPVNWYPWGEEALTKARAENKPILVSIGYAACHWCHVMERESFEDENTAALMNEHFINIKIDREERPDLDHIYMDAVQAITGSGGWPLNVFLTPDTRPFYGGTYFPPRRAFNRASWPEILQSVSQAFNERRHEIDAQAENLIAHLEQSNSFGQASNGDRNQAFSMDRMNEAFEQCMKSADKEWGGFGKAPKFPQTFTIQFLLRYHYVTDNKQALDQALLSLDKMIEGGIYDQAGGGFARYATDIEWLAPHFEKMLYDNALLIGVLSEAYQLTKKERYKEVIEETMDFIVREMLHPEKAFYTALDADSEGEEGKFYVWDKAEVESLLGEDADIFCRYYDITDHGNWEEKNILRVKIAAERFAEQHALAVDNLKRILARGKEKLLRQRSKRVRPLLDDKILLGWNALMNSACSKAYAATGNDAYRALAIENMTFLLDRFKTDRECEFAHVWKLGEAKYPAFLDDYAFLIQALIDLQEITADTKWLRHADAITQFVIAAFSEQNGNFFYYTKAAQADVIVRKKEVYDGAVPSGNSVMAYNLHRLSIYMNKSDWKDRSMAMVSALSGVISRYPTSFGGWACLLLENISGTFEIVIMGIGFEDLLQQILGIYVPHKAVMGSSIENQQFALLAGKPSLSQPAIYLCKEYECQQPVDSIARFMLLINRDKKVD